MQSVTITLDEIRQILSLQNPWWANGVIPKSFTCRNVDGSIGTNERPFVRGLLPLPVDDGFNRFRLIIGPRRVGKSTAMYRAVEDAITAGVEPSRLIWIRLDHPRLMHQSLDTIVLPMLEVIGATVERPAFLFLDELAYLRDWDLWLKTAYDDHWPVRIVATSSGVARLRKGRESGVGRWTEIHLMPYLFDEALDLGWNRSIDVPPPVLEAPDLNAALIAAAADPKFITESVGLRDPLMRFLFVGGFPETLAGLRSRSGTDKDRFDLHRIQETLRDDAFEKIVFKDIPQAFGVNDTSLLQRLAYTLAGQVAQLFSPNNLSSPLQASNPTLISYSRYLAESFLMFFLPNWSRSERSIQSRGRKIYFVDGALRNAILQRGDAPLGDRVEMGHLFENAAASHLWNYALQESFRLFHWRDKNLEVDLILDDPRGPMAFEIETGEKHRVPGLDVFVDRNKTFKGHTWKIGAELSTRQVHPPTSDAHGQMTLEGFLIVTGTLAARTAARRL